MRVVNAICVVGALIPLMVTMIRAQETAAPSGLPIWAYPVAPAIPPSEDDEVKHVPGSPRGYSKKEIANQFEAPDWFPETHPRMPKSVSEGRRPNTMACGYCHLPNGQGRPENASLAGLPMSYILEQMNDFKNGLRESSEPRMTSVQHMTAVAKAATPSEMESAAEYFAALRPTRWIRVVESATVPRIRIAGGMLLPAEGGGTEPLGERVIELPENPEQTELRNATSGFVAYVPIGSLKRGEELVKTGGNGETMACALCHGPDLRGVGNVPSIVGRSPSQMTRQLIDIQRGSRKGAGVQLMKGPVARLTVGDIVVITGYLASQQP